MGATRRPRPSTRKAAPSTSGRAENSANGYQEAILVIRQDRCYGSTPAPVLNVADFTCFLQKFAGGAAWANCDHSPASPSLNVADFPCFPQRFAAGCS